jgi:hypothetical protein
MEPDLAEAINALPVNSRARRDYAAYFVEVKKGVRKGEITEDNIDAVVARLYEMVGLLLHIWTEHCTNTVPRFFEIAPPVPFQ